MKKLYLAVGLVALFVAFATLGFQCQKVTDPASDTAYEYPSPEYAPPFSASDFENAESCQSACADYYAEMMDAESARHAEAMAALAGSENKDARDAEQDLFHQNVVDIRTARLACIRSCHDQGGLDGDF